MPNAVKIGFIYGASSILLSAFIYFIRPELLYSSTLPFINGLVLFVGFLVYSCKQERAINDGVLSFGEALKTCMITFSIGMSLGLFFESFLYNIDKELMHNAAVYGAETAESVAKSIIQMTGSTEAEAQELLEKEMEGRDLYEEMLDAYSLSSTIQTWVMLILGGLIGSLIISAFVKKN